MIARQFKPAGASACNDNGFVQLAPSVPIPGGVLDIARRVCGLCALSYVASGSMLVTAAARPLRSKAA